MASFLTKKKRQKGTEVIHSGIRDNVKFKGYERYYLNQRRQRFSVDQCGNIDWITDYNGYSEDFEWLEKEYGTSKKWYKFNEDNIGVRS